MRWPGPPPAHQMQPLFDPWAHELTSELCGFGEPLADGILGQEVGPQVGADLYPRHVVIGGEHRLRERPDPFHPGRARAGDPLELMVQRGGVGLLQREQQISLLLGEAVAAPLPPCSYPPRTYIVE